MNRKIFLILLFLLATGCATQTRVDIAPVTAVDLGKERPLVAIAPFSSNNTFNIATWEKKNLLLYEAFKRNFIASGMFVVPFEEVMQELYAQGKIKPPKKAKIKISPTIMAIYQENWSPAMKAEIERVILKEARNQEEKAEPLKFYLARKDLFLLGKNLGAKYVLSGRINTLIVREAESLDPFKIGFITAQNRFLARFLYGASEREDYSRAQEVSIGVMMGSLLGSKANSPFEGPHPETFIEGHPLFGKEYTRYVGGTPDHDLLNAIFWGAAGGAVSFLASHGGYAPEAICDVSVYLYDTQQEKIIWENRIRVRSTPQTMWAERHPEDLILDAVEEAARRLSIQLNADLGIARLTPLYFSKTTGRKLPCPTLAQGSYRISGEERN